MGKTEEEEETELSNMDKTNEEVYREAFDHFDGNHSKTISTSVSLIHLPLHPLYPLSTSLSPLTQSLVYAMRRAGQNPTELEIRDMINQIDQSDIGKLDFSGFLGLLREKEAEVEEEELFKTAFRAFSKDMEG
jgi:Ca2+-binding EF-hand superfamily protein